MRNISNHVSYNEAIRSNTARRYGMRNYPNAQALANMKLVSEKIFEPLRGANGNIPIRINSFYRSVRLNRAIGGSSRSQHCKGQAIDLDDTYGGMSNMEMAQWIIDNLDFDQLILEFPIKGQPQWVHVSYVSPEKNRNRVLVAKRIKGKTKYLFWNGKNHL